MMNFDLSKSCGVMFEIRGDKVFCWLHEGENAHELALKNAMFMFQDVLDKLTEIIEERESGKQNAN